MSLETLPPLRDALAEHGLMAKKAFGQHFLLDLNITRKIVRLAGILPGETVIEVGPGPGGLTRALLEAGAHVVAVEKDARFVPLLEELALHAPGRLHVVNEDALIAASSFSKRFISGPTIKSCASSDGGGRNLAISVSEIRFCKTSLRTQA